MTTQNKKTYYQARLDTPLGSMIAIADDSALYLLDFTDRTELDKAIARVSKNIVAEKNSIITLVEKELAHYFNGTLTTFKTPLGVVGSDFQKSVWQELQNISLGQTRSYTQLAISIGRPSACRAVARANSTNRLSLIVPCHRVINANNELGGYAGGVDRKQWLINHEKKVTS